MNVKENERRIMKKVLPFTFKRSFPKHPWESVQHIEL